MSVRGKVDISNDSPTCSKKTIGSVLNNAFMLRYIIVNSKKDIRILIQDLKI
ncbi:hypothetical protein YC2023_114644 [Brassica napus]